MRRFLLSAALVAYLGLPVQAGLMEDDQNCYDYIQFSSLMSLVGMTITNSFGDGRIDALGRATEQATGQGIKRYNLVRYANVDKWVLVVRRFDMGAPKSPLDRVCIVDKG